MAAATTTSGLSTCGPCVSPLLQVVDVNRTSKGARAGRVQGFSALVVVGNQNVSSRMHRRSRQQQSHIALPSNVMSDRPELFPSAGV